MSQEMLEEAGRKAIEGAAGPVDSAGESALAEPVDPMLEEYQYESMFGTAEVFTVETDEGKALRLLYIDGGFQSATFLGQDRFVPPFTYCKAFDALFNKQPEPRDLLLIGGGAFSYPKHVLTQHVQATMDVVEIDPVVIDIARRHFFLDELEVTAGERLRSFAVDGMEFLRNAEPARYDAVVNDSFAGTVQDAPLLSAEGLALAKRALRPGGLYLLNAVAENSEDEQDWDALEAVRDALARQFAYVRCDSVEDEEFYGCVNHIFIAGDEPLPFA